MDLSGYWAVFLDTVPYSDDLRLMKEASDSIRLPGTTDEAGLGVRNQDRSVTDHLSRVCEFQGQATYLRQVLVPESWRGRLVRLTLERSKPSDVYVDGKRAGFSSDISTSQQFDLTDFMSPGLHSLAVVVDNTDQAVPRQVLTSSHAYSSSTQTNWNGVIGEMRLESLPREGIEDVRIRPLALERMAEVTVFLRGRFRNRPSEVKMEFESFNHDGPRHRGTLRHQVILDGENPTVTLSLPLGEKALEWNEFTPSLYRLSVRISSGEGLEDVQSAEFGLRDFKVRGKQFMINDLVTFLRGKHDACVFPLTGYPPMDVEAWRTCLRKAKDYGINHYRFHSWCPPEACFKAADLEGVYLQPELPIWGNVDRTDTLLMDFLIKEGTNIQKAYGNHPSFVMMALGNEMSGTEALDELVRIFRQQDDRHLITSGSNNNLGRMGPQKWDEYFTTCRVGVESEGTYDTQTRASFSFADAPDGGYLNHVRPNTIMDFSHANSLTHLPVISHETGQFQIYPLFSQIAKYTGVLRPWNLEVFRQRLADAGMAAQAEDFSRSSGKWAVQLYKADMEMNLRTPDWGGFQLLDIQDYPGQGSAYVGILDAFMDSKGLVTPEEWRMSCASVTVLAAMEKYVWDSAEEFRARILIPNYGPGDIWGRIRWRLNRQDGSCLAEGNVPVEAAQGKVTQAGSVTCPLSGLRKAERLTLELDLEDGVARNVYPVWVYPPTETVSMDSVVLFHSPEEAAAALQKGRSVLLIPDLEHLAGQTVGGLFQTDYWNYKMFRSISESLSREVSPGTLGILADADSEAFSGFPTEAFTSWQWFNIIKNSRPLILDRLRGDFRPLVQVVDNVERNHRLGLLFEMRVGKGKVLVLMSALDARSPEPEVRAFLASLMSYAGSEAFNPEYRIDADGFLSLFRQKASEKEMGQLFNISKY